MKFTPGPWGFRMGDGRVKIYANGEQVAAAEGGNMLTDSANAHLICAAPELYESAKLALSALQMIQEDTSALSRVKQDNLIWAIDYVTKAIAKAEGKS